MLVTSNIESNYTKKNLTKSRNSEPFSDLPFALHIRRWRNAVRMNLGIASLFHESQTRHRDEAELHHCMVRNDWATKPAVQQSRVISRRQRTNNSVRSKITHVLLQAHGCAVLGVTSRWRNWCGNWDNSIVVIIPCGRHCSCAHWLLLLADDARWLVASCADHLRSRAHTQSRLCTEHSVFVLACVTATVVSKRALFC